MQYPPLVTKFDGPQQAQQMLLGVGQTDRYGPVGQDVAEVRAGTLVHQTNGLVRGREGIDQLDHIFVPESAPQQLDLPHGREVDPLFRSFGFDCFDGHLPAGPLVSGLLDHTPRTLPKRLYYRVVIHLRWGWRWATGEKQQAANN